MKWTSFSTDHFGIPLVAATSQDVQVLMNELDFLIRDVNIKLAIPMVKRGYLL